MMSLRSLRAVPPFGFRYTLYFLALIFLLSACTSGLEKPPELEATATTKTSSRISSDKDDAEERASGLVINSSTDLELTHDVLRGQQRIGLRFDDIEVPRGATIKKAYIQFKADETDWAHVKVAIHAEDTDDAKSFPQGRNRNISSRKQTSAKRTWTIDAWKERGERGAKQRTPDLSALVQEVTSRKGWRDGNALAFIVSSSVKDGKRVAESYRGDKKGAPTLYVEYSGGKRTAEPRPSAPVRAKGGSPRIILDTDVGVDVDDAGALAVLHALADRGEAKVLATVSNTYDPYAAAAIDVINTYYGRPNLPVGRNANKGQLSKATPWWRKNDAHFVRQLAARFPHDTDLKKIPSAVSVYRKALASQPDGSVTVVSVGFMSNLSDLLVSGPDKYSSLSGKALVKRKVKELVIMGGTYPGSDRDLYLKGTKEHGITPSVAGRVLDSWPTKMTFAAGNVCGDVMTGQSLARKTPKSNPVRESYKLFFKKEGVGRDSWDPCAVLYAVRGFSGPGGRYFAMPKVSKHIEINKSGTTKWVSPNNGRHQRLVRKMSRGDITALLENLMTAAPKR